MIQACLENSHEKTRRVPSNSEVLERLAAGPTSELTWGFIDVERLPMDSPVAALRDVRVAMFLACGFRVHRRCSRENDVVEFQVVRFRPCFLVVLVVLLIKREPTCCMAFLFSAMHCERR
jgi:hypothetical protein